MKKIIPIVILGISLKISSCVSLKTHCASDTYTKKAKLTSVKKEHIVINVNDTLKRSFRKVENYKINEEYFFKIRVHYNKNCLVDYREIVKISPNSI